MKRISKIIKILRERLLQNLIQAEFRVSGRLRIIEAPKEQIKIVISPARFKKVQAVAQGTRPEARFSDEERTPWTVILQDEMMIFESPHHKKRIYIYAKEFK